MSLLAGTLRADSVILGPVPRGAVVVSPDARRWATIDDRKDRFAVVVDGQAHPPYDWIIDQKVAFTADSKNVVYAARVMQKQFMVTDGVAGPLLVEIRQWTIAGNRVVCAEAVKAEWYMVREGENSEVLKRVRLIEGLAAPAFIGGVLGNKPRERVFFQGKGQEAFDQIGALAVSPDGKRIAYAARDSERWMMVTDGRQGQAFDQVLSVRFSPDSKRVAWVAQEGKEHVVLLDGKVAARHALIRPEFDVSDAGKLAYVVRTATGERAVIDGKELEEQIAVEHVSLSPDGLRWAAFVRRKTGMALLIEGREFGPFQSLSRTSLNWTADNRHMAVIAQRDERSLLLIDGKESASFAHIHIAGPVVIDGDAVRLIADDGKNLLRVTVGLE